MGERQSSYGIVILEITKSLGLCAYCTSRSCSSSHSILHGNLTSFVFFCCECLCVGLFDDNDIHQLLMLLDPSTFGDGDTGKSCFAHFALSMRQISNDALLSSEDSKLLSCWCSEGVSRSEEQPFG